ncbi:MAG: TIR domain-containing protein [Desulfobacteraceae bacterium]|nr:TIR domain-containing protein [Desulfobacteraceae bacterium]
MANKKHLEIIKQGVDVWNKWRKDNPDVKPDLQRVGFRGADLKGVDLKGAGLQGANLQEASLQGADLQNADLRETDLQNADFQNADLQNSDLEGANLQGTNLQGTYLKKADLRFANLYEADLLEADLLEANLRGANLQKAKLWGANLREADLLGADLQNAKLRGAKLLEADLQRANLQLANLKGADLTYIKIDQKTMEQIPEEIQIKHKSKWFILYDNSRLISRSIEFPPEYHQAGISILNYFGTVLRKKYPDVKATVQIKQEDLKVTMIIDPFEGDREVVEKTLDKYGLVVTGKMTPEEFTDDKFLIIELKSQLRTARSQIETQRELRELAEKSYNKRIKSLEEEVHWLRNTVGQAIQYQHEHLKNKDSETKDQSEGAKVFISCAEDDRFAANKIYDDLKKKGIIPWSAHKDINAGENTDFAVRRAIKESNYFLALLSTSSMNERGAFQKELKQAFDILTELPQDGIFIIPVRLEDCNTNNPALRDLHIIDMHKTAWNSGLDKILQALQQSNSS